MANPDHVRLLVDADKWQTFLGQGLVLDLYGANLEGVNFRGRSLSDLNLSNANLRGADFRGSRLSHVDLTRTDLKGALLASSVWLEVELVGADLSHADLSFSRVVRSNLTDATLVSSCLFGTIFQQTVVTNADFGEARSRRTVWSDLSLLQARNLERVYHSSPSTLGLDTIIESHGQIPEVFLRGCGVPDEIIAYVRSLALSASPIQLYLVFHQPFEQGHRVLPTSAQRLAGRRRTVLVRSRGSEDWRSVPRRNRECDSRTRQAPAGVVRQLRQFVVGQIRG